MNTLGIIAGAGALPCAVARSVEDAGGSVFLLGLRGAADSEISRFPHEWAFLGEAGRMLRLLREKKCNRVLFAGRVPRPGFSELKTDTKGVLLMPRIAAAARRGDDALLRSLSDILAEEGFSPVGIAEAAPALLATEGRLGRLKPDRDDMRDIELGIKTVRMLGGLDIGQATIVCHGLVLAVEAAEGTDAMIRRAGELPQTIRGTPARRRGVLVKALKPTQDGKTDLPAVGVHTVANAADAGLAGIAVEAGRSVIVDRQLVQATADRVGLFLFGFGQEVG
ncbi:MAG TPA: UDP-2,3-diacylglucosamine diphosphatase LpxI [Rhizomicrobium sp.]|nr:UDP-2,3-diacylglucosamine diphosphatase LpxI [Rhizomicrobium sp.]